MKNSDTEKKINRFKKSFLNCQGIMLIRWSEKPLKVNLIF